MTTTTIVEVGHPPVPHRELPDTGNTPTFLVCAVLLASAGLCVVRWACRTHDRIEDQ